MKNKSLILLAGILIGSLSACVTVAPPEKIQDPEIGYWDLYNKEAGGGIVYYGNDDMAMTPEESDSRYTAASGFVENVAFVAKCMDTNAEGRCNYSGIAMMDATGHLLNKFGEYNYPEIVISETEDGVINYVSLAGTVENFPMWYVHSENALVSRPKVFTEDRLLIEQGGLYGFVDRTGRAIIAPRFMAADNFKNGEARVFSDQGFGHIDLYGKFTPDTEACIVAYDDMFKRINIGGTIVNYAKDLRADSGLYISESLKLAHSQRPDADQICVGGKWGLVNFENKTVVPPEFDKIEKDIDSNLIWASDAERNIIAIYKLDGTEILPPNYPAAILGDYFYIVKNADGKFALFSTEGKPVTEFGYDAWLSKTRESSHGDYLLSENLVLKKEDKWGAIAPDGHVIVPFEYEELTAESEGLIGFRKGKRWGVIDTSNKEILSPIYGSVGLFEDGRATAELAGDQIYIYRDDGIRNAYASCYLTAIVDQKPCADGDRGGTAYELDGVRTEEFPFPAVLPKAKPVIEYVPGWQCDISGARRWEDLPQAARDYVEYVEREIGCRIGYVSVGPARDEIVIR